MSQARIKFALGVGSVPPLEDISTMADGVEAEPSRGAKNQGVAMRDSRMLGGTEILLIT